MKERVRGIIVESDGIVLMKRTKKDAVYYVFPGGGVEEGEDKISAMKREAREELGIDVEVGNLFTKQRFDRDEVPQTEYFFFCKKTGGTLGTGDGPEFQNDGKYEGSHDVVVVPIGDLGKINLLPVEVRELLEGHFSNKE
jgi:8-oxo-dGTP pyrophosphatase MutT (NUDIX family)